MTTPAVIKQADLRKLVTMAKEHRVQIEWERDGVKIKVTPDADNDGRGGIVLPKGGIRL